MVVVFESNGLFLLFGVNVVGYLMLEMGVGEVVC